MLFIKGNVPSSKNSRINTTRGSFMSKTAKKYLRGHGIQSYSSSDTKNKKKGLTPYKTIPMTFPVDQLREMFEGVTFPCEVGFHFVRDSKRSFDFHNAVQIIFDLLTAIKAIPDDDTKHVIPRCILIDGNTYTIDKKNPGVWLNVRSLV